MFYLEISKNMTKSRTGMKTRKLVRGPKKYKIEIRVGDNRKNMIKKKTKKV